MLTYKEIGKKLIYIFLRLWYFYFVIIQKIMLPDYYDGPSHTLLEVINNSNG